MEADNKHFNSFSRSNAVTRCVTMASLSELIEDHFSLQPMLVPFTPDSLVPRPSRTCKEGLVF